MAKKGGNREKESRRQQEKAANEEKICELILLMDRFSFVFRHRASSAPAVVKDGEASIELNRSEA